MSIAHEFTERTGHSRASDDRLRRGARRTHCDRLPLERVHDALDTVAKGAAIKVTIEP